MENDTDYINEVIAEILEHIAFLRLRERTSEELELEAYSALRDNLRVMRAAYENIRLLIPDLRSGKSLFHIQPHVRFDGLKTEPITMEGRCLEDLREHCPNVYRILTAKLIGSEDSTDVAALLREVKWLGDSLETDDELANTRALMADGLAGTNVVGQMTPIQQELLSALDKMHNLATSIQIVIDDDEQPRGNGEGESTSTCKHSGSGAAGGAPVGVGGAGGGRRAGLDGQARKYRLST